MPRWIACVLPTAKLIVTLRDPIDRTYSDYHFFGRLQATTIVAPHNNKKKKVVATNGS